MDKYQYHPIESPDQIRMLELLPGQDDEPIQVKISHRLLADLPLREALSYEWGSLTRDREIICEGKSLKVTVNLVVALTRLGPATKELEHTERAKGPQTSRLLWVDALCINQDDIDERNEQVKLMGDIYGTRVGRWHGLEKLLLTLLKRLSSLLNSLHQSCNAWKLTNLAHRGGSELPRQWRFDRIITLNICWTTTFGLCNSGKCHGRNLFTTKRGYCGVGPAGDNRPGNPSPAVQERDLIASLGTAPAPMVLRKIDEEYY
jgi:hypothetical protein